MRSQAACGSKPPARPERKWRFSVGTVSYTHLLGELFGTLGDTGTSVANVMEKLDDSLSGLGNISDSASSDLAEVRKALDTSASLLTEAADKIESVSKTLGDACLLYTSRCV